MAVESQLGGLVGRTKRAISILKYEVLVSYIGVSRVALLEKSLSSIRKAPKIAPCPWGGGAPQRGPCRGPRWLGA
jgi:hypothetical protein